MTHHDDPFDAPRRGDKFEPKEHPGELLLFFPTEFHAAVPTKFSKPGEPDPSAVTAHIVFVDGPSAGTVLKDSMVFGRFMVGQLKGGVNGKAVLGRLGQGQNTKGNPPWVIIDPTDEDRGLARTWYQNNGDPRSDSFVSPPPTSPVSAAPATGGGNPPAAPVQLASTPAANGASGPNPADLIKLAKANIPIAGMDADQIALIAATL